LTDDVRLPNPVSKDDLRLADFIRLNVEPIVAEWIKFAQTRTPASDAMTRLALKDHIVEILNFVADDLESAQSKKEQIAKSKGLGPNDTPLTQSAAQIHATLRLGDGFDIDQMVSEYRALRASVVKQWLLRNQALAATDLDDLTRFNEAIDQAVTESIAQYTKMINHSRNLFLGILGHDLRNPIGAAQMAAQLIVKAAPPETKPALLATQINSATGRAIEILNDLLDITRSAFGTDIPIVKEAMDMGQLATQIVDEMRTLAKGHDIAVNVVGDTDGHWDKARIGQVFSNLIGNAVQYSPQGTDVFVTVADHKDEVLISVHNDGNPIPSENLKRIFDSMTRGTGAGPQCEITTNLGLGLFITKKIVTAHGGDISVTSSGEMGTTFTVLLPRH
jgi:signal transduction histidine kinase